MFDYLIATDSTADLPKKYLSEEEITVFNLTYSIMGKSYGHGEELPGNVFYNLMREGNLPLTSQVNPEEAGEGLRNLLKKNKNILFISFSSGLSGTYNSVRLAAEEIMDEDSSANISVVDSLSASLGEGMLVYLACEMRKRGESMTEVCKFLENNKLNLVHLFTVDDLNHLYRGGRVSRSTAIVGTVLNIKPILHVDNEGHLVALKTVRGRKKSLLSLVDEMEARVGARLKDNKVIFISHGDCPEDAEFVRKEVSLRFGIDECIINIIGPTIGAHSGPGTVALFFLGDDR